MINWKQVVSPAMILIVALLPGICLSYGLEAINWHIEEWTLTVIVLVSLAFGIELDSRFRLGCPRLWVSIGYKDKVVFSISSSTLLFFVALPVQQHSNGWLVISLALFGFAVSSIILYVFGSHQIRVHLLNALRL